MRACVRASMFESVCVLESVCVCVCVRACVCVSMFESVCVCVCEHGRNHHILWGGRVPPAQSDCHWCLNEMKVGAKRKKQDEQADIRLFFFRR